MDYDWIGHCAYYHFGYCLIDTDRPSLFIDNIFKLCGAPQIPQIPAGNRSFLFLPLLAKAKLCNQERLEVETEPEIPKSAVLEPEPEPVTESEEEAGRTTRLKPHAA